MIPLPPSRPLVRAIIGGVLVAALVILIWVFWPAPGPSPAEDALKKQNEALIEQNKQLAADAAARTEEAKQLREDANAKLQEITPIRTARRAARRDGAARRDAIIATPDEQLAAALRAQHDRTRKALGAVRTPAESAPVVVSQPQPR